MVLVRFSARHAQWSVILRRLILALALALADSAMAQAAPAELPAVPDDGLTTQLPRELSPAHATAFDVPADISDSIYFQIEYVGHGTPSPESYLELHYTPRNQATAPRSLRPLDRILLSDLAAAGALSTPATAAAAFSFRLHGTSADATAVRVARAFRIDGRFRGPVAGFITFGDLRTADSSSVPGDLARRLLAAAESVAAIQLASGTALPYCTGSLVGERTLLTAAHCVTRSTHYQRTRRTERPGCSDLVAIFGFYSDDAPGRETARCEAIDHMSMETDVALLRLGRSPGRPTLAITAAEPAGRSLVSVLQHPDGRPLRIATACWIRSSGAGQSANHDCPTLGGSSGAPLLGAAAGKGVILAMHRAQNIAFEETLRGIANAIIDTCRTELNQNCLYRILSSGLTDFRAETWGNIAVPATALRSALAEAARR